MQETISPQFPGLRAVAAVLLTLTPAVASAFTFPESATPEVLASGFSSLEGPAWDAEEQALYFSDQSGECAIYRWTDGGEAQIYRYFGINNKVNGNAIDSLGRLVTCESNQRRVVIEERDSSLTILPQSYDGKILNEPNDVVVKSDGTIWFTTPSWSAAELSRQYVLRYDPATEELTKMVEGVDKPNGLGFSPDEKTFYLNDNGGNRVLAYPVLENGSLGAQQVLVSNVNRWPDGMTVDDEGNIFMAAWGGSDVGINVFTPDGTRLGILRIPGATQNVTNCTFGGPDNRWLFVTAGSALWRFDLTKSYPPAPVPVEVSWSASGEAQLAFDADPAFSYQFQGSTDGTIWTQYLNIIQVDEAQRVTRTVTAGEGTELFRVIVQHR